MQVTHYKESQGEGPVIAYVDFHIQQWNLHLAQCRLIKNNQGGKFIGYPSKKYEFDGETKYAPFFWFDKEATPRFQKAALTAIDEYHKKQEENNGALQPVATTPF